jgi:YD repeat-containing protein
MNIRIGVESISGVLRNSKLDATEFTPSRRLFSFPSLQKMAEKRLLLLVSTFIPIICGTLTCRDCFADAYGWIYIVNVGNTPINAWFTELQIGSGQPALGPYGTGSVDGMGQHAGASISQLPTGTWAGSGMLASGGMSPVPWAIVIGGGHSGDYGSHIVTGFDVTVYSNYPDGPVMGNINYGAIFDGNAGDAPFGGCLYVFNSTTPPVNDKNDNDNNGPQKSPCGMPVWSVSEPYISLWLNDEPLGYQPALGSRISFQLAFKQREYTNGYNTNIFSVGKKWNVSWFSYVSQDANGNTAVYFDGGRQLTFNGTNVDYLTDTHISGSTSTGYTLNYPDGRQDVYGFIVTNNAGAFQEAFLTQHKNAQSLATTFNYYAYTNTSPVIRLQNVVDADGKTSLVYYNSTNPYSTNLISQVVDPFGRTVNLSYDSSGHLTNITDVATNSSSFAYDVNDWVTNLTTPYGTTSFQMTGMTAANVSPDFRSVLVTQPDSGNRLYLFDSFAPGIATNYVAGQIPSTATYPNTFDTNDLNLRNTFYWGPLQYASLSTNNLFAFTTNDFRKARMRHWLLSSSTNVGETISLQREPSPDSGGYLEGRKTWYDYAGKTNIEYEGTQAQPLFIACVLPDGTTSFQRNDRNLLGNVLTKPSLFWQQHLYIQQRPGFDTDRCAGIDHHEHVG